MFCNLLKNQKKQNFEVVVCYDFYNSEINNFDLLNKYKKVFKYNLIIIVNTKSSGFAYTCNLCLKNCNGEYVIFLKENIILNSDFSQKFELKINNKHSDIVIFNINESYENKPTRLFANNKNMHGLFKKNSEIQVKNNKSLIAFISAFIYDKAFKMSLIKQYDIYMKQYARYNTLYLYQFIRLCGNY